MNRLPSDIPVFEMPRERDSRLYSPEQAVVGKLLTDHYAASGGTHKLKETLLARFEEAYEKYGLIFEPPAGRNKDYCLETNDRPFPSRYYDRDFKDFLAIYRGFKHFSELDMGEMSISWSFAFKKAIGSRGRTNAEGHFSNYPFEDGSFPKEIYLARALVHPKDVLAWFPCRGENEAVFRPIKAFLIEVKHFPVVQEEYEVQVHDYNDPSYYSSRPKKRAQKQLRWKLKGDIQEWNDLTF